jgi:hypothetical protein
MKQIATLVCMWAILSWAIVGATASPSSKAEMSFAPVKTITVSSAARGPVVSQLPRNLDGSEDLSGFPVSIRTRAQRDRLDVVGSLYQAGTTYYELQHNQTAGRTIALDQSGNVHLVFTHADSGLTPRHVYYNVYNISFGGFLHPGGVQFDSSFRAGFASLAVDIHDSWVFPAYHQFTIGDPVQRATVGMNQSLWAPPYVISQPDTFSDSTGTPTNIWPKIAYGRNNVVHMVSTRSNSPDGTSQFYYSRGVAQIPGGVGAGVEWQDVDIVDSLPVQFMLVDTTVSVSANIAASFYSNRVVMVWNKLLRDPVTGDPLPNVSDIYVMISEDNGLNWGAPINVTGFCGPDANCPNQDWGVCNGDTLRAWTDNTVVLDGLDNIHVAFTVVSYHYWDENGTVVHETRDPRSAIWYWNSGTDYAAPIATAFGEPSIPGGWTTAGNFHRAVCKPSLAVDTTSFTNPGGDLFCSYWRGMPDQWSANMFPMGDVYISRSNDNGFSWSEGRNITETDAGQFAPAGSSLSEREPCLAEHVGYAGFQECLHLFYVLDFDAGTSMTGEGTIVENDINYQQVPVDSIPAFPTVPWQPLHTGYAAGACCYINGLDEVVCEQKSVCECAALGGEFYGIGSTECAPEYDHCPGQTIDCLPFTASGNNCCATPDWEDCGVSTKEIFYNYTPSQTTTARMSLCDSPVSWDSYISIYAAGANGSCTDSFRVGCLDDGCADPNHVNQLFTFTGGQKYYILVCGYFLEDCGPYVFNMTDETDYSQPDTLLYDNEETYAVYVDSVWASVRFTAPAEFELNTAYVKTAFGNLADDPCDIYLYYNSPAPGGEIAEAHPCVPSSLGWQDPVWVSTYLDNPVTIPGGMDFWVVAGPQAVGTPGENGWKTLMSTSSSLRSSFSNTGLYGSYTNSAQDFMLRVGGTVRLGSPDSLVIQRANDQDVLLTWSPVYGASEYDVYRSLSEDIQPLPANQLGSTAGTSFIDPGVLLLPDEKFYYIVTATASHLLSATGVSQVTRANSVAYAPMQEKTR